MLMMIISVIVFVLGAWIILMINDVGLIAHFAAVLSLGAVIIGVCVYKYVSDVDYNIDEIQKKLDILISEKDNGSENDQSGKKQNKPV